MVLPDGPTTLPVGQQLLINLISNAIERLRTRDNRYISISLGASDGMLEVTEKTNIRNTSSQLTHQGALTGDPRWGNGKEVCPHFFD